MNDTATVSIATEGEQAAATAIVDATSAEVKEEKVKKRKSHEGETEEERAERQI